MDLVALHDLCELHFLAIHGADPLLVDPTTVSGVQLVEPDVFGRSGGDQFHRHVDEPETDRSAPDSPRHSTIVPSVRQKAKDAALAPCTCKVAATYPTCTYVPETGTDLGGPEWLSRP